MSDLSEMQNAPAPTVTQEMRIEALARSDDWKTAKRILATKIQSMTSILDMTPEDRKKPELVEARYLAANLIVEWIGEIDGTEVPRENNGEVDPDSLRGLLRLR